jgi:hypothetical protein
VQTIAKLLPYVTDITEGPAISIPTSTSASTTTSTAKSTVTMSFPSFGEAGAQPQPATEEQGGFGAPGAAQQQNPIGQQMDPSQQQAQFPGAPQGGAPGAQGPQPGGDRKTTLW